MRETINKDTAIRVPLPVHTSRGWQRGAGWTAVVTLAPDASGDSYWHAEAASEKAALAALTDGLESFLTGYRAPSVLTFRGFVAVVALSATNHPDTGPSWHQQVAWPDGHVSHSYESAADWAEAEASARHHLAQASTDWHDDASVHGGAAYLEAGRNIGHGQYGPDDFYRYAAWQRAARAAMDAGRDDWHQWASDNQADYAVSPPDAV
jgi:hypothetical protein